MQCFDKYERDRHDCQIGLDRIEDWISTEFAGYQPLGCLANRDVRGRSGVRSLHAEGRAHDGRFASFADLDRFIATLIANAAALNVQAFNDYHRQRRWRCDRGWTLNADIGAGAGGPTIHVERNWAGALDDRPVPTILREAHQEAHMPTAYTAKAVIPWLDRVNGHRPKVVAALDPKTGATTVTGIGCVLCNEGGTPVSAVYLGVTAQVMNQGRPLNAPIDTFDLDEIDRQVIGIADDLGDFTWSVKALT